MQRARWWSRPFASVCTGQLILLTRSLRGGRVFPVRSITPSKHWGVVCSEAKNGSTPHLGLAEQGAPTLEAEAASAERRASERSVRARARRAGGEWGQ